MQALLPIDNDIRILVGQEAHVNEWRNSLTWSDFGGGQEKMVNKDGMVAAREFEEETMGMFGCKSHIHSLLEQTGKKYELLEPVESEVEIIVEFLLPMKWKEVQHVPKYYRNIRTHFTRCSSVDAKGFLSIPSCPKGMMEKVDLEWVKVKDIFKDLQGTQSKSKWRKSFSQSVVRARCFLHFEKK